MSTIKTPCRYNAGNGEGMFDNENGEFVLYSDYAALQQEVEQLSAMNQSLQKGYEAEAHRNAALQQEVERLRDIIEEKDMLIDRLENRIAGTKSGFM